MATRTRSATSSTTRSRCWTPSTSSGSGQAIEEVRRRVQQDTLGHRGRKNDPLYRIRNLLRSRRTDLLTDRQSQRIETGLQAGDPTFEVTVAWRCYQQLRSAYHATDPAEGRDREQGHRLLPQPARSPRSPGSAEPCARGRPQFWPTSTTGAPATAAPKPSTASSNSTAASPAASTT